jgi:pimeloyl-[acyl-carrier protein] methyl ester esterase
MRIAMLPGLDGTGLLFGPALDVCPAGLEAVVQPLPREEPLSYPALAESILPDLPITEPYLLLAESFSGPLALEIAARKPTGLCGVVLVATFVTSPCPWWLPVLPWSWLFRITPPAFLVRLLLLGRRAPAESLRLFKEAVSSVKPQVMASRVRLVSSVDARRALEACPVPILYLRATRDSIVREDALAEILRVRSDVEHHEIVAPHLVLQAAPEEVWRRVLDFARERQQREDQP